MFAQMPQPLIDRLHAEGWHFYTFIGSGHARLMCSWQTREEDILLFGRDLQRLAGDL